MQAGPGPPARASGSSFSATSRPRLRSRRAVDLAHPTRADHRDDFVRSDPVPGARLILGSAAIIGQHDGTRSPVLRPAGSLVTLTPILPRSRHLPLASTEGSPTRNLNKMGCACGPDAPSMSTVKSNAATRSIRSRSALIARLEPMSGAAPSPAGFTRNTLRPAPARPPAAARRCARPLPATGSSTHPASGPART